MPRARSSDASRPRSPTFSAASGSPPTPPTWTSATSSIVVNAEKIAVTGNKREDKRYWRHSGYPGGIRSRTLGELLERRPEEVIRKAVKGMLPRNRLGRQQLAEAQGLRRTRASPPGTEAQRAGDRDLIENEEQGNGEDRPTPEEEPIEEQPTPEEQQHDEQGPRGGAAEESSEDVTRASSPRRRGPLPGRGNRGRFCRRGIF